MPDPGPGRDAAVIHMAAGGKDRLNAMYMVEGYGEQNPIVEKSQFVMSSSSRSTGGAWAPAQVHH